jgi:hypothetical protein
MYVPHEKRLNVSNAVVRVHKQKRMPERFHVGHLSLCLPRVPLWLVLLMSALTLGGCDSTSSTNFTTGKGTPTPNPQVHASWQMQLETAQKEAAKIDPTAVIHWITTYFTDAQLTGDKDISLRTAFTFIRPNGVRIEVEVEDTSPPKVLWVVPDVDTWTVKPSQEDLQRYASLVSNVKIGPRELVQKVFEKNINDVAFVTASMALNWDHQEEAGVANPWIVGYDEPSMETSTRLLASPVTGEILKRDTYTLSP